MRCMARPSFLFLALVAGCALIFVTYRFSHEEWMVDDCLSAQHGSFDYSKMSCDLEENHPYIPYHVRHPRDSLIALVAFVSFALFLSGYWYSRATGQETRGKVVRGDHDNS
jgi:hypothetical protein